MTVSYLGYLTETTVRRKVIKEIVDRLYEKGLIVHVARCENSITYIRLDCGASGTIKIIKNENIGSNSKFIVDVGKEYGSDGIYGSKDIDLVIQDVLTYRHKIMSKIKDINRYYEKVESKKRMMSRDKIWKKASRY